MNLLLSFMFVLVLSTGNFIPYPEDDMATWILKVGIMVLLVIIFAIHKDIKLLNKKAILYITVITIIFLTASLRTEDLAYSLDKYISCGIVVLILYILFSLLERKNNFIQISQYIVQIGFGILILTILYKIQFGFWERDVRFFLNGPITFSWMMGLYCLLSINIYKHTKQIIYIILSVIYFIAILWTQSKGGLLATAAALIFYFTYTSKYYIKIPILSIFGIILAFSTYFINILADLTEGTRFSAIIRVLNNNVSAEDGGSITIRQNMISEATHMWIDNPLWGIGISNYQFKTSYGFVYPHNAHLELLLEFGVIVGLLYLFFLIVGFLKAPTVFKSAFILFGIAASFSGDITYLRFLFFICLIGQEQKILK